MCNISQWIDQDMITLSCDHVITDSKTALVQLLLIIVCNISQWIDQDMLTLSCDHVITDSITALVQL